MSKSVLIVGSGSMGAALAKGLAKSKAAANFKVTVHDIHDHRLATLSEFPSITTKKELSADDFKCDALVLSIKPQDLPAFREEHGKSLKSSTVVITILAGITIGDIETTLRFNGPVIRAMPNIAASFGQAATAMCTNQHCAEPHKELAQVIFDSVGSAWWKILRKSKEKGS